MSRYYDANRLALYLSGVAWAIDPSALEPIKALMLRAAAGERIDAPELGRGLATLHPGDALAADSTVSVPRGTALVRIHGPVIARADDFMRRYAGAIDPYQLADTLRDLSRSDDLERIVLSFDSPGGTVKGTEVAAAAIAEAATRLEVVAVIDDQATSAAAWLAAQATRVAITESGLTGSIGVFLTHFDLSAFYGDMGVKADVIRSGALKAPQSVEALTTEQRASLQAFVDRAYDAFIAATATGRSLDLEVARARWGDGRIIMGRDAITAGLADTIDTLEGVLGVTRTPSRTTARRAAAATSGGTTVDRNELLALLALPADATDDQIATMIATHRRAATALAATGLKVDSTPAAAAALAAQAADGLAYREGLTVRLKALTVSTTEGTTEQQEQAAERAVRVWGNAEIGDLRAEVERLETLKAAAHPAGRASTDPDPDAGKAEPARRNPRIGA